MTLSTRLLLAILVGTLLASGQTANQAPTAGQVPDESVLPQWSATFPILLKAKETYFLSLRVPKRPVGPLSDEELINGRPSQPTDIPRLQGAEDCTLRQNTSGGAWEYKCFFLPHGSSATDMQSDFVRLVRLVEHATGGSALQSGQYRASPTSEHRHVIVNRIPNEKGYIAVDESWLTELSATNNERANMRLDTRSRLSVWVVSDSPPNYQPPTASVFGGELPITQTANQSLAPGTCRYTVINQTGYGLMVSIGAVQFQVQSSASNNVILAAGTYSFQVKASAPDIPALSRTYTIAAGFDYTSTITLVSR
jgi:hypothetical protein